MQNTVYIYDVFDLTVSGNIIKLIQYNNTI